MLRVRVSCRSLLGLDGGPFRLPGVGYLSRIRIRSIRWRGKTVDRIRSEIRKPRYLIALALLLGPIVEGPAGVPMTPFNWVQLDWGQGKSVGIPEAFPDEYP